MPKAARITLSLIISACFVMFNACTISNVGIGDASSTEGAYEIVDGRFYAPGGSWSIELPEQWLIVATDSSSSTFQIVIANGTAVDSQLVIGDEGYQVYDLDQEAESWRQNAIENIGEDNVGEIDSFSTSSGAEGFEIAYQGTEGVSSRLVILTDDENQLFSINLDTVDDPFDDESNDLLRSFKFEE